MSNSSNYTKDVVVFFDWLYKFSKIHNHLYITIFPDDTTIWFDVMKNSYMVPFTEKEFFNYFRVLNN